MPKAPKPAAASTPDPVPDAIVKTRKAGPGLTKPYTPSPELATIVGPGPMPRTEVVAKVWDHIRSNGLQDKADRRTIVADDKLRPIIGARCTMFELPGKLAAHMAA